MQLFNSRWWDQYKYIPWPDSCCLFISTCLLGHDERGRLMRRTIARYLVVALIQVLRCIDVKVKKRFPTLTHLSEAGILTDQERKIIEDVDAKCIQVGWLCFDISLQYYFDWTKIRSNLTNTKYFRSLWKVKIIIFDKFTIWNVIICHLSW